LQSDRALLIRLNDSASMLEVRSGQNAALWADGQIRMAGERPPSDLRLNKVRGSLTRHLQ